MNRLPILLAITFLLAACATVQPAPAVAPQPPMSVQQPEAAIAPPTGPTASEAAQFAADAEARLATLDEANNHAQWVQATYITYDTQILASAASETLVAAGVELAKEAANYDKVDVAPDVRRKLDLLKLAMTTPGPGDPAKNGELARLASKLKATYGSGKYCPKPSECWDIEKISDILATSSDPKLLLEAWTGWHTISPPMRDDYTRLVQLMNEGARELGYRDTGAMWRSKYDMPPDAFAAEVDRLWGQVKPLYDSLHCYVRWNLTKKYGADDVPPGKPIPAHLLGNLWAQEWGNIYDLVAPKNADPGYDLTKILQAKKVDARGMVKYGENFFSSLGFAPLPKTFWDRSLFVKPADRDVVCHASAWDLDNENDIRIKMCIDATAEDFQTIHHELGHNYYQRAYAGQPLLFKNSANDGFHEAIGDTVALSITPGYLKQLGLIKSEPPASRDIGLLLRQAMDKIAFLPFGLLVDQWRWKVLSGEISPAEYNGTWWELKRKYQGVAPPNARSESDFDPGAKYHIPANVPYTRYFLAAILQYQFHRALCQTAGYEGPLNRCSIYGNKDAGARLAKTLEMGQSRPWPDAMEALTGQRQMDATAIIDYFAPLEVWLDAQNEGQVCGW